MDEKIKLVLKNLGLEEREIKIYLALVSNGSLTAMQISKETKIDRTTVYDILTKLENKGISSSFIKNKTKHFTILTPNELLIYFKEKYSSLNQILPQLNQLTTKTKEEVSCQLFEGKEGIKTILKDLIESKKDYKVIGIRKEYEEILNYFHDQGFLKLTELNVKEKAIVERETKFKKLKNGNYRYVDNKLLSLVTTLIYGNKVVFFIWAEPYFSISIENKTFSKAQSEYFDLLWEIAKK